MEKNDKIVAYGICILAVSAILMTWISHSVRASRKAEPPKAEGVPWTGSSPSTAAVPPRRQESPSQTGGPPNAPPVEQHATPEPTARPAYQPSHPQADAPPASRSLPSYLFAPPDEEPSPPDSDQLSSPKPESAAQRVGRRLRRH